jgi:hypothetical protein
MLVSKKNESNDLEDCRFSYNGMPAITGGSINSYDEQDHPVFYAGPMSKHLHPKHYLCQNRRMAAQVASMATATDELWSLILQNPDLAVWEVASQEFAPPTSQRQN